MRRDDLAGADLLNIARSKNMAALAAEWLPPMLHPEKLRDKRLVSELAGMICRASLEELEGEIAALLTRPDALAELERIECPTTVMCGRQDRWSPVEQHELIHLRIARSRLVIIEDAGHMTPI